MRLTIELKERILNEALKRSNEKKAIEAAKKVLSDFAVKAITEYHSEDGLKELEADAKKLHKLANKLADLDIAMRLSKTEYVKFSFARDKPVNLSYANYYAIALEVPMYCKEYIWMNSASLALELRSLSTTLDNCNKAYNELKISIRGVLESVNTVKQLIAVWGEAAELLPENVTKSKAALPMIDTTNLNKSLNLPTAK